MRQHKYPLSAIVGVLLLIGALSLLFLFLPINVGAQSTAQSDVDQSNAALLASIRAMFEESFSELKTEVQGLRNEVQTLRAEVQQDPGGSVGTRPNVTPQPTGPQPRFTTPLGLAATGEEVRRLQATLISLGFNVPAGVTGNFLSQTQRALRELQGQHGIPITGVLDLATIGVLNDLIGPPTVSPPPQPVPPTPIPPTITVTPTLQLRSPLPDMLLNIGTEIPISWNVTDAPDDSEISFRFVNILSGYELQVLEVSEHSGSRNWTLPSNMPGDNEFIADLFLVGENGIRQILASKSVGLAILGGTPPPTTPTSPTTGSVSNQQYVDFYTGATFTSCMESFPATVTLIEGWLDEGLLQYQFPWGQITGAAANKLAECSQNQIFEDDYNYADCLSYGSESMCSEQSACLWFDTFCGNSDYNPGSGSGGGGGSTQMYSCFYPNATINGQAPGYTVWCEEDYQNCHEGDQSGASVSLDGLTLGAPSSCESGYYPGGSGSGGSTQCSSGFHFEFYEGSSVICFSDGAHDQYQVDQGATISCSSAWRDGCTDNNNSGGGDYGYCGAYSEESSCTAVSNCYWQSDASYCYYSESGASAGSGSFLANVFGAMVNAWQSLFGR